MARLPRLNLPDIPQHIVQRGNNRQACFVTKQDRIVYLEKLKEYSGKFEVAVHAFVLMTNHVHILATPHQGEGVSLMMQALGRYYVRYFNKIHARTGTLWEGRFKSALVDTENYFLTVSRYIELNPVRAKMVEAPAEYKWTSYHHNARGIRAKLITEHPCYLSLGCNDLNRQSAYRALFDSQLSRSKLDEIRSATNRAWVLGGEKFKRDIEIKSGVQIIFNSWGGNRWNVEESC
ncbi:transposase [Aliikangiella coralliicola]|uniref:Transposase n=1 Tax=Aliikangiella coralliicola TaxID=2592383 RepID=A0A545UB04_9GAMM|nr:transposase [Aliikangiella coralliicola]TQV86652.1 transposase [Aliikangiella coralliicola]